MSAAAGQYDGLKTLEESGRAPSTRMENALQAGERIKQMMDGERRGRSGRRALVKGLVDGNPPYRAADLRRAARANQCNVNWRVSEYYLNQARSAFYDVFSESPTYCEVITEHGTPNEQVLWSKIITEEFDRLIREDPQWDYINQISQFEMILYGCGPIVFCDETDWRNEAVLNQNVLVPDFSLSDVNRWEECVIVRDYQSHELYDKIRQEDIATKAGWNVSATKQAIMRACPKIEAGGQYSTWEWHQQMLKNHSYWYSSQSKIVQAVHYYYREFPKPGEDQGKITHCILPNPEGYQNASLEYLYQSVGCYDSWLDIIHPIYYDNDGGGYHHSVTGLGTKMYSAMEYQNRLLCNLADKTFAPKILFRPTTANANEQLNIIQFGDYGKVPAQFEVQQIPIGSYLDDGLAFHREMTRLVSSNLSQYSPALSKESGNPITAYEASIRASEQARLGKTQLNHYYNQMDRLYERKYWRASCPRLHGFKPGGGAARAFQARCLERGVPRMALERVVSVKSARITGQGSQFMRQQSLEKLLATVAMWPSEAGRNNLLSDYIASLAGQALVERYNPTADTDTQIADQRAHAMLQVAAAKSGVAPVITGTQNHYVYAAAFLQAAGDAVSSLEQGGDPYAVYQFLETIGPAIAAHISGFGADPTRGDMAKEMQQRWMELTKIHDQLGQTLQKMAQEQAKQQQQMQEAQAVAEGTDPDTLIKAADAKHKMDLASAKTRHQMQLRQAQADQKLAINDLSAASKILAEQKKAETSGAEGAD